MDDMSDTVYGLDQQLPDPLPASPLALLKEWFDEAQRTSPLNNPNAMTLATVDPDGRPSVRVVLCRAVDADTGSLLFFTNRRSRKGLALGAHPDAAIDFFWDWLDRQAIVEGPATFATDAESDAYHRGRPLASRVAAWASDQSRPIASRHAFLDKIASAAARFGVDPETSTNAEIPRPPHWGGYRITARRVELWCSSPVRAHDRAEWTRDVTPDGKGGFRTGPWRATRLQP